jgi:multisubunit Na+/H+ antiporter MnhB subunit
MKEQANTQVENLVDKMMKSSALESPSVDFTSQILSKIENLQQSKSTVYQPLISKRVWAGIVGVCMVFLVYIFNTTSIESSSWFATIDFSKFTNNRVSESLSDYTFSKTMMYAIILLSVMVFIQIPLLKNHFEKRL